MALPLKKITNADTLIQCMSHAVKGLSIFLVMAFFYCPVYCCFYLDKHGFHIGYKRILGIAEYPYDRIAGFYLFYAV